MTVRALAFYLPQFHPTPENDAWWGSGFTEWRTVSDARPLFSGHHQPRRPERLAYYDLRVAETRAAQAALAEEFGIAGFCYWHYWFGGRRLLEHPFDSVRALGEPDFPFCLAWANESWTGTWVGRSRDVLVEQVYNEADHRAHAEWLCDAFEDDRYIRVDGRPLVYVYRPHKIPFPDRWREIWNDVCVERVGATPYLVGEIDYREVKDEALVSKGVLDAATAVAWDRAFGKSQRARRALPGGPLRVDYQEAATRLSIVPAETSGTLVPTILTGWDNTPRYAKRGVVLDDYSPEALEAVARRAVVASQRNGFDFAFVKSWNEWSEGNYLEPDLRHGTSFLAALHDASGNLRGIMRPNGEGDYFELDREEIVEFAPASAHRVLEIGAGSGGFATLLRERFGPSATIVVVEPFASPTAEAVRAVNDWQAGTLSDFIQQRDERDSGFDLIVMNDVLEHLENPWDTLDSLRGLLTVNGQILISVPNARSPRLVVDLLVLNDFRYRPSGVLDRTHLRFFTSKSVARLLDECGYEPDRLGLVNSVVRSRVPAKVASLIEQLAPTFTHRQVVSLATVRR